MNTLSKSTQSKISDFERAINEETGYANGKRFSSEEEVRKYFTIENMVNMFGPDHKKYYGHTKSQDVTEHVLRYYGEYIIATRSHCDF